MAAKIQEGLLRCRIDLDRVGLLVGHVAVDAKAHHSPSDLLGHGVATDLMTSQALFREPGYIALRSMNVGARRARHRWIGAKELAAQQQPDLIAVHVRDWLVPIRLGKEKVGEPVTRPVRKRRLGGLSIARVAQGAVVQLPVPREARRIEDILARSFPWVG